MNQLINITQNENNDSVVSGRELHDFLEVSERYSTWFERMVKYGFEENVDFVGCKVFNTLAKQELQDHALKLDMAKEISMIQRTAKGKEARQYFIQVEKEYKQQQQVPMTLDQQIAAIATGYGSVKEELVEMKDKVLDLTDRFGLPARQNKMLTKVRNYQVIMILGGKDSNAYQNEPFRKRVYRELWSDFIEFFEIDTYASLPLSRIDEAIEYTKTWQPSTNTNFEIRSLNSQTSFEFEPA